MSIVRFSVSLDKDLVAEFDRKIKDERCPTRSKAVGDLIRAGLVQTEWQAGEEVVFHPSGKRSRKTSQDCHLCLCPFGS